MFIRLSILLVLAGVAVISMMPGPGVRRAWATAGCYDVNGDNTVNAEDVKIVGSYHGAPAPVPTAPDVNGDNAINAVDSGQIAANWGPQSCQTQPASWRTNVAQSYVVTGTSNGVTGYTVWVGFPVIGGTYNYQSVARPPLALASPASAFATDFAAAVNGFGVPGLFAVATGATFNIATSGLASPAGGLIAGVDTCALTATQPSCTFNPTVAILSTGGVAEAPDLSALSSKSASAESDSSFPRWVLLAIVTIAGLSIVGGGTLAKARIATKR